MKRGFTLIELLAVIVILAIIALIATPIIINIISDSKESSSERSAELYLDAVEYAVADKALGNKIILDGTYNVIEEGNICLKYEANESNEQICTDKMKVEVNGETPKGGYVILTGGKIKEVKLEYANDFVYVYKTYYNGEVVYFDIAEGKGCNEENYDITNSNTGYNGFNNKKSHSDTTLTNKLETQNSCLKFYAFNDDGGDSVNLLLDHNTTINVLWNSSGSNTSGPKEVIEQLKIDTENWKGTQPPANYMAEQLNSKKYEINYSQYKARLITAEEIAKITKNEKFDASIAVYDDKFYFDSLASTPSLACTSGDTTGCMYGWLYDRTNINCTTYGCLNNSNSEMGGYWTATSIASNLSGAWNVVYKGYLNNDFIDSSIFRGVRPVIEVLKNKL